MSSNFRVPLLLCVPLLISLLTSCGDSVAPSPVANKPDFATENQSLVPETRKAGPVENIEAKERMEAVRLIEAHDPVVHEIKIYDAEIRGAFDEHNFEFLEEAGSALRGSGELFGDGSWKIFRFYEAIDHRFHSGDDGYLTDLEAHREWEKAYPDSITRRIALAKMLVGYAWHARGNGYAHTVTPEGWRNMVERLEQASLALADARNLPEKDPYWFSAAQKVALGQGSDAEDYNKLLEDARVDHPGYWHLETERAYSLLPRWYGEEGDWERFALEAADVPGGLGAEAYARVIIRMSGFTADVFRDSDAEWSKMKPGMEALLKKYPESVTLKNEAAYHATVGRDREMAAAAFEVLGEEYVKDVWKKPERFVHFRTWARTGKW